MLAMAQDDGPSRMADIQRRLGVDVNYASQYRLRLIAAELIRATRRGYVDFALPYLRVPPRAFRRRGVSGPAEQFVRRR